MTNSEIIYKNKGCDCINYNNQYYNFYSNNTNITKNVCASACFDNNRCTSYEIRYNEFNISQFCLLWFDGACYEPTIEYNYITTYSIESRMPIYLNYSLCLFIFFILLIFIIICINITLFCIDCYKKNKKNKLIMIDYESTEYTESNEEYQDIGLANIH